MPKVPAWYHLNGVKIGRNDVLAIPSEELLRQKCWSDRMLLELLRRKKTISVGRDVRSLADAAHYVLAMAQSERLPLAYIAGRAGAERAAHWFATNILQIVTVDGRRPENPQQESLTKDKLAALELDDDMKALRTPGEAQPQFIDLSVSAAQFAKYIEFVRTTQ